ncbi:MAG: patatin-like phospholipase family protein, partial [Candidatus Cloacimonetes bacterium]|nr:patatin-like phospholipase family protein [Candidatus Cloacimonadota bacterium]
MNRIGFLIILVLITCQSQAVLKIGLALSGGGARGLAHIGVLKVLDEQNIKIDCLSGTSIGAIIGGLYAMGYSAVEIEEMILAFNWREILDDRVERVDLHISMKRWKPYAKHFFSLNNNFIPELPQGIFGGHRLLNKLFYLTYPVAHITNFDDLKIPFSCTATNVLTGELKVFTQGSLLEAIKSSITLPTLFEPFEYNGELYIDGGINANFPVEIVTSMGAEFVIGSQTNSGLKKSEELVNLIDVLDQTVGFGISRNVDISTELCDLLIKPDLDDIDILDFDQIKIIIERGEIAARMALENFGGLPSGDRGQKEINYLDQSVKINNIKIKGNQYLSSSKIKEYLELKNGTYYNRDDIYQAVNKVFNSDLFSYVYPVLSELDDDYTLTVKVKEKNRKHVALSFTYNNNNEFVSGVTLDCNNYLQRNSKLLFNLKLGNETEVNLDYVKNFGKNWGIYFRLFPYFKEFRLYSYNEDHEKMKSVKSREAGGTLGLGVYVNKALNAEFYTYTFRTKMYRDIADFDDTFFRSSGIGVKLYHESLDNYLFPLQGGQIMVKFSTASKEYYSDEGYKKFYSKLQL